MQHEQIFVRTKREELRRKSSSCPILFLLGWEGELDYSLRAAFHGQEWGRCTEVDWRTVNNRSINCNNYLCRWFINWNTSWLAYPSRRSLYFSVIFLLIPHSSNVKLYLPLNRRIGTCSQAIDEVLLLGALYFLLYVDIVTAICIHTDRVDTFIKWTYPVIIRVCCLGGQSTTRHSVWSLQCQIQKACTITQLTRHKGTGRAY